MYVFGDPLSAKVDTRTRRRPVEIPRHGCPTDGKHNIATRCRRNKKIDTKNGAWSDEGPASLRILTSSTLRLTRLFGHGRRRCLRTTPYDTASRAPKHQRSLATRAPPTMGRAARPSAAPTKVAGGSCSKRPGLPRNTVERLPPRQRFGRTSLEPKLPRACLDDTHSPLSHASLFLSAWLSAAAMTLLQATHQ